MRTTTVTLRELQEKDWPAIKACLADQETVRYTEFEPFSEASAQGLVQWAAGKRQEEPRTAFVFGICLSPCTELIGIATLTVRDSALRQADFGPLGLHRIYGECDPANPASARVMEKVGTVREGHLREHRWQKGRWVDRLLYAVLDHDPLTVGSKRIIMPEPEVLQQPDFVSDPDILYKTLVSEVAWEEHIKARKTASFGEAYNYSRIVCAVKSMHPLLVPVVDKLEQAIGFRPNNCLLNFYEDGDSSMGYHSDSTEELAPGTGVAIVSLGAEREITFRSKADSEEKYQYPLANGSLLYMSQEIQDKWKHAILKQADVGGRISLTFRQLSSSEG